MTALSIDIRRKSYPARGGSPGRVAIENLSIAAANGEFLCLVGPSGCGKTTLLHLIAGLDTDYDGRIDTSTAGNPRIGYVFQEPRLLPWRTVRQNIELALPDGDCGRGSLIDSLLKTMGLQDASHQYPRRLSLGMSRRAALVRAFALEPDLLLMDEPLVSLDAPTARKIRELLVRVWLERPHTVIYVTHDLREAIALADRLVFLKPSPAAVLHEVAVAIPRDHRGEAEIEAFRQHLVEEHPEIRELL
ncbi:MAG: ABC transporter ATP-binding protein [Methylococcaceae bacterium]|nr:ABC transporter ATP-binding protein [Methylococcaceae bacterium]